MSVFPRKLKRDLLIAGGLEVTGNTTLTGSLVQTGAQTFTGRATFNGGIVETVQSLTGAACARPGSTAGTALLGYGISKVALTIASATGAANFDLKLNGPVAAGVHKFINLSHTGASTYETKVMSATTTVTFFGSTGNAIQLTTDWVSPKTAGFHLIGVTTAQWAIIGANAASTQWSITGATFGTT